MSRIMNGMILRRMEQNSGKIMNEENEWDDIEKDGAKLWKDLNVKDYEWDDIEKDGAKLWKIMNEENEWDDIEKDGAKLWKDYE